MQRNSWTIFMLTMLLAAGGTASAATPTAEALVAMATDAAESGTTMDRHDMIRVAVHHEETTSDGTASSNDFTVVFHGGHVENCRVELSQGVSLALSGTTGWAMIRGEIDSRPQTPQMAAGTIHQMTFPLLLPFSLRTQGVNLGTVTSGSFDGTPAWVLEINFESGFFAAPSMVAPWTIFISKEDHLVLGAQYLPAHEYRGVIDEGVRYRILKRQDMDGIKLPVQILMDGIDFRGMENGHVRVIKTSAESAGPLDLSLFISPEAADRMEAGDF